MRALLFSLISVFSFLAADDSAPIIATTVEGEPSTNIENCVNAITGQYYMAQADLVVPGRQPITIPRLYFETQKKYVGKWLHFPHTELQYFADKIKTQEPSGTSIHLRRRTKSNADHLFKFDREEMSGITNTGRGSIGGRTNLSNHTACKKGNQYILTCGDGTRRYYSPLDEDDYHNYLLEKERLSNGCFLRYEYTWDKKENKKTVARIASMDPTENIVYAWVEFTYKHSGSDHYIYLKTSDDRNFEYHYRDVFNANKEKYSREIYQITYDNKRVETFLYDDDDKEEKKRLEKQENRRLYKREHPRKRELKIDRYILDEEWVGKKLVKLKKKDKRKGRVRQLVAPITADGSLAPTHKFFYHIGKYQKEKSKGGSTEVVDGENNRIIYGYDENNVHQTTEYYGEKGLFYHECFVWDRSINAKSRNLLYKYYKDKQGRGYLARGFEYDDGYQGNVISETLYGNLSGDCEVSPEFSGAQPDKNGVETYQKTYTYTTDGFNLIKEEKLPSGKKVLYEYLPDTHHLRTCYHLHNEKIVRREFYEYDPYYLQTRKTVDDGSSFDPDSSENVTTCRVTETSYYKKGPARHLPKEVKERYHDPKTGAEHLLKTTHLAYDKHCHITCKQIYDDTKTLLIEESFKYDFDNLIEMTDAFKATTTYEYDEFNNLTTKYLPSGLTITYTYDNCNREVSRIERTKDLERGYHTNYDLKSKVQATRDQFGNSTKVKYDLLGRLEWKESPAVLQENDSFAPIKISIKSHISGKPAQETDGNGHTKKTEYTARGEPSRITYPDGTTETFHYNLNGTLKKTVQRTGRFTLYKYDLDNRPILKQLYTPDENLIEEEHYTYDSFHLRSHTKNSITTTYDYDGAGRKISETIHTEDGTKSLHYEYSALGHLIKTTTHAEDAPDRIRHTKHDIAGRLYEEREEDANQTLYSRSKYSYDHNGNKTSETHYVDGKKLLTLYKYDAFDRLIAIRDSSDNQTYITYNENYTNSHRQKVLLTTTYLPNKTRIEETHDTLGRLATKKVFFGHESTPIQHEEYRYDANNNKTHQISHILGRIDSEIKTTRWYYNSNNDPTKLIEAANSNQERTTTYTYTPDRKLQTRTKPDGTILTYTYDTKRRQSTLISSDKTIAYRTHYNSLDQPDQIDDLIARTRTSRKFDSFGNLLKETLASGHTLTSTYNGHGQCTSLTLPDKSAIRYTHNAYHLLTISREDHLGKTRYSHHYNSYDLSGNPRREKLIYNLGTLTRTFDKHGEETTRTTPFSQENYLKKDPNGNLLAKSLTLEEQTQTSKYSYDTLDQLTSETGATPHTYAYDSHYNRTEKDSTYNEIDIHNQLRSHDSTTYLYDLNGNPIKKVTDDLEIDYSYDALDRLIAITYEESRLTFTYDGDHRRLSKTHSHYTNDAWTILSTETYLYDNDNEIGAIQNDQITQLRILGLGRGAEIGAAIAIELNNKTYLPIHSIRGDLIALIDPLTHKAACTYHYSAYGEHTPNPLCPWRFQSKRHDHETNLTYFGRRYYDSETGRFITPDPKGFTDIPNPYPYVLNNPLTLLDLYGLETLAFNPFLNNPSGNYALAQSIPLSQATISTRLFEQELASKYPERVGEHFFSSAIDLKRPELPNNQIQMFVNGICNDHEDFLSNMRHISEISGGYNVHGIHNATHGFTRDAHETKLLLNDIATEPVHLLKNQIMEHLNANTDATIKLFLHSQGAAIGNLALRLLDREYQKRITVIAIAPAKFISDDVCRKAYNYVSSDGVTKIQNVVGKNHLHESDPRIIRLTPHNKWKLWMDHSFQSPTYVESINEHTRGYKR